MAELLLRGSPASPGAALGPARVLAAPAGARGARRGRPADEELAAARAALAAAAAELDATADRLRAAGRRAEAAIVEAGTLMALDPALDAAVDRAVTADGLAAAAAILAGTELHAGRIAALPDANLAARADDVRSLGRRAARLAAGAPPEGAEPAAAGAILVATDLGPADVAELEDGVAGIALAAGGATAHAAIVARSLGIPMAVGLGEALLDIRDGEAVALDGDAGEVAVRPSRERAAAARAAATARAARRRRAAGRSALPAKTRDGRRIRVLVNAAGAAEVRAGVEAGAEGIGLLRTELAFLDARDWPDTAAHRRALEPVLEALGPDRPAIVRVLDFGGDKTPPFLRGAAGRGIALLLEHPPALAAQLAALAGRPEVRVLLPMVEEPGQVEAVRAAMAAAGLDAPLGAMVETPAAARAARALAERCAFLSIGTNDLTAATLGQDRFAAGDAPAYHPAVLRHIDRVARAARAAGIPLEVCGEAASDPVGLPLLLGLGVDELSVGAARVGTVRDWVRALDLTEARTLARHALAARDAGEVRLLVEAALDGRLGEGGDAGREAVDRAGRVGALGA